MNSTAGDLYGRREDAARNTHDVRHSANDYSMQAWRTHTNTQRKQIEQIKRCPDTNIEFIKRKH